jgi:hypothetical protein
LKWQAAAAFDYLLKATPRQHRLLQALVWNQATFNVGWERLHVNILDMMLYIGDFQHVWSFLLESKSRQ